MEEDWTYIDSRELKQVVAYNNKTGIVWCCDGTKYTKSEVEILRKHGGIVNAVHLIKKVFEGIIIE